ncbi:Ammonia transport outward protein 3 [Nakaseomyces bracarensis]|uniref:Ammonia transport outward protein 3 n=1 Tax=Nakaseomyces bracarensis TaxID=273131 RepID=A0ABR4NSQ5_9SACH
MSSSSSQMEVEKPVATDIEQSNLLPHATYTETRSYPVQEIYADSEFITLGGSTYRRNQLIAALGIDQENQGPHHHPPLTTKLANPVPLGLASFSICCLVLSLVNANVRGVTNNQFVISMYMLFGGAIELFAGLLCFVIGDTFSMTVFSSFGGFWLSYGLDFVPSMAAITEYDKDPRMLNNIIGFYLAAWCVFTFLMLMCTLKSAWGLFFLLFFLDFTFLMLCIGNFIDNNNCKMAGGYFGILASVCGFYMLYCCVSMKDNSYVPLRALMMPNAPA